MKSHFPLMDGLASTDFLFNISLTILILIFESSALLGAYLALGVVVDTRKYGIWRIGLIIGLSLSF